MLFPEGSRRVSPLPLNRQSARYAHEGVELSLSTLADQVAGCALLLHLLYDLIRNHVFAGQRVHGDDTTVPVLARKPGALRNGAPFKDWVLPANLERIKRKLAGSDAGDRQMVKVLAAVLSDGLPAVEAACAEALAEGVHSADVILNILARRREPPPAPPVLIPEALRLRHAPIADCARYDQLRRTG